MHMAQLMPLPLTVSCFSKIHIGFTFLVLAHPGSPGQRDVKWLCVCVFISVQPFFVVCVQVGHASALGFSIGQDISVKYFGRDPASGKMRLSRKAIYSAASAAIKSLHDNS